MQLSSDCLYHFTNNVDSVKAILSDKFKGSYCKEVLNYNNELVKLFIPMISFCDIPLKSYSNLGAIYGKFGIGMSKQWAVANKLNPVLYIDKNSLLLETYIKAFYGSLTTVGISSQILTKNPNAQGAAIVKNLTNSIEFIVYALFYTKHYDDNLERLENKNYRFYDEREWRYIPEFQCAVCELKKTEEEYNAWRQQSVTKPLLEEVILNFTLADVEYIMVETRENAKDLIQFINELPEERLGDIAKEIIYTRIICYDDVQKNI